MRVEPIRKRIDFAERAQRPDGNALHSELSVLEQHKEMTLWRRDALCHPEQIDCLRQAQFRKAANLEPADTEQDTWRCSPLQKLNRKCFAALVTGENKDSIRVRGKISASQPIEEESDHQRLR